MSQAGKALNILIYAAIFILLEIAALAMLKSSSSLQNIWINRASHRTMAFLWSHGEKIRYRFQLQEINERLAQENFLLNQELRAYRASDTALLKKGIEPYKEVDGFRYIPASIVKMSRNTAHNYIILNKGSDDGVTPHSGIITSKGVVGIIDAVGRHYSYGLTFMNNNVSISARVKKNGVMGPLVWDGKRRNGAVLRDLPLHFEVNQGDTVITSGISTIFPPDIPLGTIGESKTVNGALHFTAVNLFQDFSSIKNVTIAINTGREEIESLEKKEEQ